MSTGNVKVTTSKFYLVNIGISSGYRTSTLVPVILPLEEEPGSKWRYENHFITKSYFGGKITFNVMEFMHNSSPSTDIRQKVVSTERSTEDDCTMKQIQHGHN